MNRDRVVAQLRNVERLIDDSDPQPLLSLVILEYGTGVIVAHPVLSTAHKDAEEYEAALRLVRTELIDVAAHFERLIDESIRVSARAAG
jgi:hypothetical protein